MGDAGDDSCNEQVDFLYSRNVNELFRYFIDADNLYYYRTAVLTGNIVQHSRLLSQAFETGAMSPSAPVPKASFFSRGHSPRGLCMLINWSMLTEGCPA